MLQGRPYVVSCPICNAHVVLQNEDRHREWVDPSQARAWSPARWTLELGQSTLMSPDSLQTDSSETRGPGRRTEKHLDPGKIRVVDVEIDGTNDVLRRDCYDPNGGPAEPGDLLRFEHGELWLRSVDWAHGKTMQAEPSVRWISTGLRRREVGGVQVFTWPRAERVTMVRDQEQMK